MPAAPQLIRPCVTSDLPAVTANDAESLRRGTGPFELEPPNEVGMRRRWLDVRMMQRPSARARRG